MSEGVEYSREALAKPRPAKQYKARCKKAGEFLNEAKGEKLQQFFVCLQWELSP